MVKRNDYWVMEYANSKRGSQKTKGSRWSQEEIDYLRQNFEKAGIEKIAKFLKRPITSVRSKAYREGLTSCVNISKEPVTQNKKKYSDLFVLITGILGILGLSTAVIVTILMTISATA